MSVERKKPNRQGLRKSTVVAEPRTKAGQVGLGAGLPAPNLESYRLLLIACYGRGGGVGRGLGDGVALAVGVGFGVGVVDAVAVAVAVGVTVAVAVAVGVALGDAVGVGVGLTPPGRG